MKTRRSQLHYLTLFATALALLAAPSTTIAQDADSQGAPASTNQPAEEVEEVVTDPSEADEGEPSVQIYVDRHSTSVSVMGNVHVREGEQADEVVAILGDYVIDGEARREAVAILGSGVINGPVGSDSVTVLGGVTVNAPVGGELVVVGGTAYINSTIEGDVALILSSVEFGPEAHVKGETIIIGPQPLVVEGAQFDGDFNQVPLGNYLPSLDGLGKYFQGLGEYFKTGIFWGRPFPHDIRWVWWAAGAALLLHLFIAILFPKPIELGSEMLRTYTVRCFLVGVIGYILLLPIIFLLMITGVGILAVPFIVAAFVVASFMGKVAVARVLGAQFFSGIGLRRFDNLVFCFLFGTILLYLLYMVPVVGLLTFLFVKPLAVGAMILATIEAFSKEPPPRPRAVAQESTPAPAPAPSTPGPAPAAFASQPVGAPHLARVSAQPEPAPHNATPPVSPEPKQSPGSGAPPVMDAPPRLEPDTAEMASLPRVGFWPRIGATLLDGFLIAILFGAVLEIGNWIPLIWFAYHVVLWTWRGTTLGGIVFGLRIIREDGRKTDLITALVRSIASVFSFVVAGLGFFWASWNPEKKSWHDMIAGTVVVKLPRITPLI